MKLHLMHNEFALSNPNPISANFASYFQRMWSYDDIMGARDSCNLAHYLYFELRSCMSLVQDHSLGWTFGP